jgi:hypothetical protein
VEKVTLGKDTQQFRIIPKHQNGADVVLGHNRDGVLHCRLGTGVDDDTVVLQEFGDGAFHGAKTGPWEKEKGYTIQRKTHVVSFLTEPNDLVTDEIGREALSMISETSGSVVG